MRFNLKKEIPVLLMVLVPYILLYYLWDKLPESVPIHYNAVGDVDGWADKSSLIWLVSGMMLLVYLIFLLVPLIDPKINVEKMGRKYGTIKFWTILFFSLITCFIIYSSYAPSFMKTNALMMLIAGLLAMLGNYFKTLPPNYFIGIRTPWTLEHKTVWKKTHEMGGKLWLVGGMILFLLGFVMSQEIYVVVLLVTTLILALIPTLYSYIYYKSLKNEKA